MSVRLTLAAVSIARSIFLINHRTRDVGLFPRHRALDGLAWRHSSARSINNWVFYSAQILFFGAELTQVYANRFGQHVWPTKGAPYWVLGTAVDRISAPITPTADKIGTAP